MYTGMYSYAEAIVCAQGIFGHHTSVVDVRVPMLVHQRRILTRIQIQSSTVLRGELSDNALDRRVYKHPLKLGLYCLGGVGDTLLEKRAASNHSHGVPCGSHCARYWICYIPW
jgi:hypothetical protein